MSSSLAVWWYSFTVVFIAWCLYPTKADCFSDMRCVCVCDQTWNPDGKKLVFKSPTPREFCNCHQVIRPVYPGQPCSGCVCTVETRNIATVKVLVYVVLGTLALLLLLMLSLALVGPLVPRCLNPYLDHASTATPQTKPAHQKDGVQSAPASTHSTGQRSWRGPLPGPGRSEAVQQ